jgi:hypothetical protein
MRSRAPLRPKARDESAQNHASTGEISLGGRRDLEPGLMAYE